MSKTITDAAGKEYTIEPRTNLSGADLNNTDLRKAKLSNADLSGAVISISYNRNGNSRDADVIMEQKI